MHQDLDPQIERLAELFGRAAALMLDAVLSFVRGESTMREALSAIEQLVKALAEFVEAFVQGVLPNIYKDGIEEAQRALDAPESADDVASQPEHRAMLELAQRGLSRDLTATTEQMRRDGESALEEVSRRNLETLMARGRNAIPQAREMEAEMRERGIVYRDTSGRRWDPKAYSRMILRTQSVEASNAANLATAGQLGSPGVRVSDGKSGTDTDRPCMVADGQFWSLSVALANKLEHPGCRRAFSPLPSTFSGELDRE